VKGIWIRRLIPASVVGIVLAFSYFAPALGVDNIAPVKSHDQNDNCQQTGQNGYGYRGKHNFACQSDKPQPANPDGSQGTTAVNSHAPATKNQPPAPQPANPATTPAPAPATTKTVIDVPVSVGVSQWRGFIELLRRQLG
jgi:hypothetical protein